MELHAHGGSIIGNLIIEEIIGLGARQAQPGEFTKRAYLNGKIDLTQAEAVADLINSGTKRSADLLVPLLIRSATASACVKSILPLRYALFVNSPGCACLAPRPIISSIIKFPIIEPP